MPRHSDAIGYLLELRDQESVSWFSKICDIAVSSDGSPLVEEELGSLYKVLIKEESYVPVSATPTISSTTTKTLPPHALTQYYLKEISNFKNFKLLSDELKVLFDKRITLIFGCNGSGKSSLCEAIKLLASPQPPENPLNNLRIQSDEPSSFTYRFQDDPSPSIWDTSKGYGIFADRIKYFDSTIAIQNIKGSAAPEKIVKIEPFRLEVFNFAGQFIRELTDYIQKIISSKRESLSQEIELIKTKFTGVSVPDEKAISTLTVSDCSELDSILSGYSGIDETMENNYSNNVLSLERLRKARSTEGLRLQKTELTLLLEYAHSIKGFIKKVRAVSLSQAVEIAKKINSQKVLEEDLAKQITPEGINSSHFEEFIRASEKIFNYEKLDDEVCPFCRRPFDQNDLQVVKSYRKFLMDKIGAEIRDSETTLQKMFSQLTKVKEFPILPYMSTVPLSADIINRSKTCIENHIKMIPSGIEELEHVDAKDFGEISTLKECISHIAGEVLQRHRIIRSASSTDDEFAKRCREVEIKINEFNYWKCVDENLGKLKDVTKKIKFCNNLETLIQDTGFPVFLRKITMKEKEAYRDLVVGEFKKILDEEYKRMTGRKISDFGLDLISTGSEQIVIVDTKVGDEPIHRVFSEGEQKIHAISLFFSEAAIGNQHIIVFDDPVTSFDYNYSEMYAERLRDYILDNPDVQVIALTHNWDFFVHMQLVINQSGLNNEISIQVLEHCCIAEEYSEKSDELKAEIEDILEIPGEPSKGDKDHLAGRLRRLIESIINTHVFNGERHQFKQKTMSTSIFNKFTKVVPLLPDESIRLRDFYRNLSVPGHEDPRSSYASISKALYNQWYTEICDIESAIVARKP